MKLVLISPVSYRIIISTHNCPKQAILIMMTSSNESIFRVAGHLCEEFTGQRWIPRTKASDAYLWCFFDLHLNKRLSKQSWGWWFETPWRHCNDISTMRHWNNIWSFVWSHQSSCYTTETRLIYGYGSGIQIDSNRGLGFNMDYRACLFMGLLISIEQE